MKNRFVGFVQITNFATCERDPLNNPKPGDWWDTNQSGIFHVGEVTTRSVTMYRNGVVVILDADNFKAFLRSSKATFGGHND